MIVTVPATTMAGCDPMPGDRPAELHGYGPIDPETACRIAAKSASFLRVLTHPVTGQTMDAARLRYRPSEALRLALQVEDEICRFPGCGRRASRCELDHTEDWVHGCTTCAANLAHLCSKHHHLKHEGGWTVRTPPDAPPGSRELEWRPEDARPRALCDSDVRAGDDEAPLVGDGGASGWCGGEEVSSRGWFRAPGPRRRSRARRRRGRSARGRSRGRRPSRHRA